jgi:hypothetical protein
MLRWKVSASHFQIDAEGGKSFLKRGAYRPIHLRILSHPTADFGSLR